VTSTQDAEGALARADEAFGRFDVDGFVAHLSAAIRAYTELGEPAAAAMACVRLGDAYVNALGNLNAGRAWFCRARRLVADLEPCIEQGWVAVAAMGCDVDDPAALLESAERALDRARRFGNLNLETKALADAGLAHVQAGRLADGMALLDEAMALACGPADDIAATSKSVCSFFTACYYAADFERAGTWADTLRRHGLIGSFPIGPAFLSSHCDSVQAAMLVELGRWAEAEELLERASREFLERTGIPGFHPDIVLADLRVRQGRFVEAEALLLGKDQAMDALLPAARLHLARGAFDLAHQAATRGLRALGGDRLRAVDLLIVRIEAALATQDRADAEAAAAELEERLVDVDVDRVAARAAVALAHVDMARGDRSAAADRLEAAAVALDPAAFPVLHAQVQAELTALRAGASELDSPATPRAVATAPAGSNGSRAEGAVLARRPKGWVVAHDGVQVLLADTKGVRYLAELLSTPGAERHALDLVDRVEGVDPDGVVDRHALGDAGPLLDGAARASYRRRIEELRAAADDALAAGRPDEAEAAQGEIDLLVLQLASAFGLGGRDRRAASAAERARLNVTRALRTAVARITDALPEAGAVLDRRIRTGTFCAFEPVAGEIRWIVRS
jgi:tetratricopeptide (TPR) repeat protein